MIESPISLPIRGSSVAGSNAPPGFHVMAKPRGAICNLDCSYCYYLDKKELYPGSRFRMGDAVLESFVSQYIGAQQVPQVTFAWQGGEPTLMGLEFFEKAVAYQRKHAQPGKRIVNTLQTNGTLLDDAWGAFLAENDFLVGISIDGPRRMHDRYRVDAGGQPTFDAVWRGLALLRQHDVAFNVLTTVHPANQDAPLKVYRFLRDEVGARHLQFIPIVEHPDVAAATKRSVSADAYGKFLIEIFDEWVHRDVGEVYVQMFEIALAAWAGSPPPLCVFAETCGDALALEHNGDLYSCDHFVDSDHLLGNIESTPLDNLVGSARQRSFGAAKLDTLPSQCLGCEVRFVCNGGCPKDRFLTTEAGEPGLNYLCGGYRPFFNHVRPAMELMAGELAAHRSPANVMRLLGAD